MSTVQDELMHYGVLGMKWGRRSAPSTLSKATGHKAIKQDAKTLLKLNKKATRAVFDEMKNRNEKTILNEKRTATNYNDFVKTMNLEKGKAYVDSVLNEANKNRF